MKRYKQSLVLALGVVIAITISGIVQAQKASASSYDYYVSKNGDDDDEGSKDKPFKTIDEAVNNAKKGDKIFIEKGVYSESLAIPKGVQIEGKSDGDVTIAGNVQMGDDSEMESVTITGGVMVLEDADVKINDATIKDASVNGIDVIGGASVDIRNTKIKNNRKGIYIKAKGSVTIEDSEVSNNDEEGIDIRSRTNIVIRNTRIEGNGESGIELIVGKSDMVISKNVINDNGSSGIATQYYDSTSKLGAIKISQNKINGNKKYGIDCNTPSGSSGIPQDFWKDSLSISENTIEKNKLKSIANACDILEKEEKSNEQIQEIPKVTTVSDQEESSQERELAQEQFDQQKKREEEQRQEQQIKMAQEIEVLQTRLAQQEVENTIVRKKVLERNFLVKLLIGPSPKDIENLKEKNRQSREIKAQLSQAKNKDVLSEQQKILVDSGLENINQQIMQNEEIIQKQEKTFSLFGWVGKL
ncbi:MAG: right-handed parallel beta-helix repeat-containing protein [Candidatus Moranbacteria bacterium]|nr:right-handed parallel beta-helix repeat-containing protein [Candidatus Moranbacteria bacterium]